MKAGPKLRHFNPLKSKPASSLAATGLIMSPVARATEKSLSVSPRSIVILLTSDQLRLATRGRITNAIRWVNVPGSIEPFGSLLR